MERNSEEFNAKLARIRHECEAKLRPVRRPEYQKASDKRLYLCECAIKAFKRRDRVQYHVGGNGKPWVWWPALAPLNRDEREVVIAELGIFPEEES